MNKQHEASVPMPTSTANSVVADKALPRSGQWLLWVGFALVALNLRLLFTTVGPILTQLGLGFASTLLVTSLPLALLGVFSMPGVKLRLWLGEERALFWALLLLILGCGLRVFGEVGLVWGTVLGSAGIAVMNVIMPVLARKRFGVQRMGLVMGVYALMLGAGAALGASLSLPLFTGLGGGQMAAYQLLGLWAMPAVLALLFWLPQLKHGPQIPSHTAVTTGAVRNVYRDRTAWAITLFFGLQVLNLFVFLPWMPTMLQDRGLMQDASAQVFALSQLGLMVGSFLMPFLAGRRKDQRVFIGLTILLCLFGMLILMYAPMNAVMMGAVLLGFGQGGGVALASFLFVAKAASIDTATRVSAMAQTVGYLMAVLGPLLIGVIYQQTRDWHVPIMILAGLLLLELMLVLPAGRNVKI